MPSLPRVTRDAMALVAVSDRIVLPPHQGDVAKYGCLEPAQEGGKYRGMLKITASWQYFLPGEMFAPLSSVAGTNGVLNQAPGTAGTLGRSCLEHRTRPGRVSSWS